MYVFSCISKTKNITSSLFSLNLQKIVNMLMRVLRDWYYHSPLNLQKCWMPFHIYFILQNIAANEHLLRLLNMTYTSCVGDYLITNTLCSWRMVQLGGILYFCQFFNITQPSIFPCRG